MPQAGGQAAAARPKTPARFDFYLRADLEHQEAQRYLGDPRACPAGARRLLGLLARLETRATFAVAGATARAFPALVRELCAAGHGLIGHGFDHRPLAGLSRAEQEGELRGMRQALAEVAGQPLAGFAPCQDSADGQTAAAALAAGLEFATYVPGAPRGPRPGFVAVAGQARRLLVLVPPHRPRTCLSDWCGLRQDAPWREPPWSAERARAEWAALVERAAESGGPASLVVHPWMFAVNAGEEEVLAGLLRLIRRRKGAPGTYPELAGRLLAAPPLE